MTPQEIMDNLMKLGNELNTAKNNLYKAAKDKAEAEREYRKALAIKQLELRHAKYPATLITDLSRGDDKVAELKLQRDTQVALYETAKYEINALHDRISIGQSMLNWLGKEFTATNQINK
jgi:hypothetical protein